MRITMLLLAALPVAAAAQAPGYSTGDWKKVATDHFLFLYPEELAGWALPMAQRMEAVRSAVQTLVGYAPEDRVTVLVDDPTNISNGSMNPGPLLFMWPTPPNPRSMIGENRGWGEILAVHEFAHAAHLTRPSRNTVERLKSALIPIPVTRIMRIAPRWVTEGYATYVEGLLTGSGRPHGVWRPAVLRTWALEGQLPTYGQLSSSGGFYGGAMAYLVGSAYLEWLVAREAEPHALPNVWARLTARQTRSFESAFAGVFGAPASELYGLFKVDVTERALAVRDAVEAAGGVVDGELFQRLSWYTGDPAVSRDGERLAIVLRSRNTPSRVVVMSTRPDTLPTRVRERQAEIFERDPEDVPPVERRPRGQRALATLWPTAGAAYDAPRWMPDGSGILVIRGDFVENVRSRADLFLWEWESGDVRRITHGAAIREADPSPDGSWAAGLRCLHARCDIVRIDLSTGRVGTIAEGGPLSPWFHPRISPDGRTIVASRQIDGLWRLFAMSVDGSDIRRIGPDDDASRFDAEFLARGDALVLTSTASGIPDLVVMDVATGRTRPLTRVIGAAVAPAPSAQGDVFFLSLHSRGWDLRRTIGLVATPAPLTIDPGLTPAVAAGLELVDTFPPEPIGPVRDYGLGPRTYTILPMADVAANAYAGGLALTSTDPIGLLTWQLRGMYGEDDAFRGGAAEAVWRGWPAAVRAGAFMVGGPLPVPNPDPFRAAGDLVEESYLGGILELELRRTRVGRALGLSLGGSAGELLGEPRTLAWTDIRAALLRTRGLLRIVPALGIHGAIGRTADYEWMRWTANGSVEVGRDERSVAVTGRYGWTDADPLSGELFTVGGTEPLLLDGSVLSQRIALPALPVDFLVGEEMWSAKAELRGQPLTFFYWTGDARGDLIDRYQLAGAEMNTDIAAAHHLRLPAARVRLGVARLLTDPLENEWRAWAVLGFRP